MLDRPLTLADADAVLAVRNAVEVADRLPLRTPLDEMLEEMTSEDVDLEVDSIGVFEGDSCIAYGIVSVSAEASAEAHFATLDAAVHPDHTGRGHGRGILDHLVARARERFAALPAPGEDQPPRVIRTFAGATQVRAQDLLRQAGFRILRYYDEMTCAVAGTVLQPPPEGVDIVVFDAGRGEETRVLKNAVFADHWGSSPMTPTAWARVLSGRFRADLSAMALASPGGEVVGFALTTVYPEDWEATGREEAWIPLIGVDRRERGRGIARALISRVLAAVEESGLTHASLSVDTDNPTGAHGLYTALGFEPTAQHHMWALPPEPIRR